jgi:hypothetical protein
MAVSLGMLLTYEWTHFLIHTPYRPQATTAPSGGRTGCTTQERALLDGGHEEPGRPRPGTFPAKSEVENSPTARTLGIDVA